ncbi:hypothetical protein MA16_Dca012008 [Dendrobium catenatum]|uniref:Uncharacterized protein n=1 Tax=Dendrobium catenatum TaxID=906689 RepID=A0A2I0WDY0_9ASPA|nr:hypothetical protein MA16_Dca012008 [Dendrobium catenatum]
MVQMNEFPSFCVSCKCLSHLRGECRIQSSAPMLVPNSNYNPSLSGGNANGNDTVVLVSFVNDGLIDGNIKNACSDCNELGVILARAESQQDFDWNACADVKNLDNVPFVLLVLPINIVIDDFGGVNEVNYNQVGSVVKDLCVNREVSPNPYLVNLDLLRLLILEVMMML